MSSGVATVYLLNPFTVAGTPTNISCNGGYTGSITITPNGGQPSYGPYAWSNGASTQNISGLSAGTYTVTVTDANYCKTTSSWVLTQPAGMTITQSGGSNVRCNGGSDGSITVSVTGGAGSYNYAWSNSGGNSPTINSLSAGTYTVTVTDLNSCSKSSSFLVTQPSGMTILINGTSPKCNLGSDGTINTTVSGGSGSYSYAWSSGSGSSPGNRTGLSAGTYTVTVTDGNSCSKTASYQITQPTAISINGTSSNLTCNGINNGSIAVTVSGGTSSYKYSRTTGHTATGLTDAVNGLSAGTYTVTVTDNNSCTATQTWSITAPTALSVTLLGNNPPKRSTSSDGSVSVTGAGGTTPYTYLWNNGLRLQV